MFAVRGDRMPRASKYKFKELKSRNDYEKHDFSSTGLGMPPAEPKAWPDQSGANVRSPLNYDDENEGIQENKDAADDSQQ